MGMGLAALTLAGCPVPQLQNTPSWQRREIDPMSGRAYWLYVPHNYSFAKAAPLIVTCHGTPPYDVAEHHIREWKMLGEQNGCIVVAPELVATDGIFGDGPVGGMLDDERFILSIVSLMGYKFNLDRANIMITGFSGGGFPAYFVGLRRPDVFSTIVARSCNFSDTNLANWVPTGGSADRQSIMVYYGENDPGAIRNQSSNAIKFLQSKGYAIDTTVIPGIGHERRPEVAMSFFRRHWRPARATQIVTPPVAANLIP
jgi:poly(3-hydroxybutyrate) depolymerase